MSLLFVTEGYLVTLVSFNKHNGCKNQPFMYYYKFIATKTNIIILKR